MRWRSPTYIFFGLVLPSWPEIYRSNYINYINNWPVFRSCSWNRKKVLYKYYLLTNYTLLWLLLLFDFSKTLEDMFGDKERGVFLLFPVQNPHVRLSLWNASSHPSSYWPSCSPQSHLGKRWMTWWCGRASTTRSSVTARSLAKSRGTSRAHLRMVVKWDPLHDHS